MSEVTVGDGVADVPADFDLAQAWSEIVEQMEHRRGEVSAIVHADPEIVPVLRDRLGRHCAEDGPVDGGRVRLRISAHLPRAIAEQLAGFGGRLEVVAPNRFGVSWPRWRPSSPPSTADPRYRAVNPPSTATAAPVTKLASSERR